MQQQNQNQMQNQQPVYQTPPQIITGKDLNYIKDMLSWNLLGMKKAHLMATQCQDPEIKAVLEKACQMHEGHYTRVLNHISAQQPAMNQTHSGLQN
jgi:spore coat protein CotF